MNTEINALLPQICRQHMLEPTHPCKEKTARHDPETKERMETGRRDRARVNLLWIVTHSSDCQTCFAA